MTRRAKKTRGDAPVAEPGQQYARVVTMLGNGRCRAKCADGVERVCRIRGNMHRREWVAAGDVVLVALREGLAGDVGDILFKYLLDDLRKLRKLGEHVDVAHEEDDTEEFVVFEPDDSDPINVDDV